jgi:hypothetical protein
MVMIKVHEIPEGSLHTEHLKIKIPRRTWLHLDREGANPPDIGIPISELPL